MILGQTPELFVATDLLRTAQELQRTIIDTHPEVAPEMAEQALTVLGDTRETYGLEWVALRTTCAFVLDRGLTIDEQVYGTLQFSDMDVLGWFVGVQYARWGRALNSLCLDLYDVTVLRPEEPDDPDEGRLGMPLLVPVMAVDNIWAVN